MGDAVLIIGAIGTALGALIGGAATALVMIWRANSETKLQEKKQTNEVQEKVIDKLTLRVEALETKLGKKEDDHRECERKLGMLEGRVEQLSKDMSEALQRHDTRNLEQAIAMKDETIKELEKRLEAFTTKTTGEP